MKDSSSEWRSFRGARHGLGKSKTQELINSAALTTAKVDGRTLVLTSSVIAFIERNRVTGQR